MFSVKPIIPNTICITSDISRIEELRRISFYDVCFLILRSIAIKSDIK